MKAACFIPTNLHACGLGALKANHLPKANSGVRRGADGEGAGGGKVFRLGKSVGLKWLFLTLRHRIGTPPLPAASSLLLVWSAQSGEARGGLYLNTLIMHAPCK